MNILVELNSASIDSAIARLERIKNASINRSKAIIDQLLRVGISTAQENTGKYAGYIKFETVVEQAGGGFIGMLIASDASKIISTWRRGREIISAEVSPLLMAEFGSGHFADVKDIWSDLAGYVGQGTFTYPDQIRNHAFDERGWKWCDLAGKWHETMGESPTYPMYSSWQEMKKALDSIIESAVNYYGW